MISTPVTWEEVSRALKKNDAKQLMFESKGVLKRVEEFGDLFAPVLTLKQKLPRLEEIRDAGDGAMNALA